MGELVGQDNELKPSLEQQELVLGSLIKNYFLLSKIKNVIGLNFFTKLKYKLIYKSLIYYVDKYTKLPSKEELFIILDDLYTQDYGDKQEIKDYLTSLYNLADIDETFVIDQTEKFIKKRKTEAILSEFVPKLKEGSPDAINQLSDKLISDVSSVNINYSKAFILSDTSKVEEVRTESVGDAENSLIIKSFIPAINSSLLYGGYKVGDLGVFVAKPGCFTGDTKVMTNKGQAITLEELYNNKEKDILTYSVDKDGEVDLSKAECCNLTKYTKDLVEVEIDYQHKIKCTPDHQFLLKSGEYKRAQDLNELDELMPMKRRVRSEGNFISGYEEVWSKNYKVIEEKNKLVTYDRKVLESHWNEILEKAANYNHKVTRVTKLHLGKEVPVYDLYNVDKYHNFTVCLGDSVNEGIVVHNCGKSMVLVNELTNAALLGYKVLHIFLGDMTDYDGQIRYMACANNLNQSDVVRMTPDEMKILIPKCNLDGKLSRIAIKSYSAGELTADQLLQNINKIQEDLCMHFDMIAIDYPDNLISSNEMLYLSGGETYDKLSYLARTNKSVVLTASQPKQSYWNAEILPLDSLAESSKKQQIVDITVTLGKYSSNSKLLTGHICKVRRGIVGNIFRVKTEFEKARMHQISEQEYIQLKVEEEQTR